MSLSADGFRVYREFFDERELHDFETDVGMLYYGQAFKFAAFRNVATRGVHIRERFADIYEAMEDAGEEEALYQVQRMMPSAPTLRALTDSVPDRIPGLFVRGSTTLIEGPGLFINRPGTDRLLYRWHTEAHYYPKRRRFLNLWWPLFGDRDATNGAMSVLPGSHLREWPFAEYQEGPHHFVQYEVPESLLGDFEPVTIEAERGDLVIFDRNLIHRSNPNTSAAIAFAGVARVWDPTDDLTLSGEMAAKPYGGDVGRAGLVVS